MIGRPISGRSSHERHPTAQGEIGRSAGREAATPGESAPASSPTLDEDKLFLGLVVPIYVCLRDDDQVGLGEARHRVPGHDILKKGYQPLPVLLREEGDGCAFLAGSNLLLAE